MPEKLTSDEWDKLAQSLSDIKVAPDPYPDYGRSIVSQNVVDPQAAGGARALKTGLLGAVLGALATRMMSDDPGNVVLGGLGGGVLGAIPGYYSGKNQAESDKTRLLALRRLGIQTPGELEFAEQFPDLAWRISAPGERV